MVKLMHEYAQDYANEIKKYLTTYPEQAEEIYNIKVPSNLKSMNKKEFLHYILSIQQSVYDAVKEMGYATPFYYNVNHFLFVNYKPVEIGVCNSQQDLMV